MPSAPPYTGARYFEVDLPTGAVAVGGFDVQVQTNYIPLAPGSFERRGDMRRGYNISNSSLAGKNYIVWYMRSWVDVTSESLETHQIYAHDTWIEWAIQDVVRRVSQKDDDSDNTMAEAVRRQTQIEDDMRAAALKMKMGGARRPRRVSESQEIGFWEVTRLPIEDGSGGLSAGKIAIMPNQGRRL